MTEEQATTLLDDMNAWLPEAWESWIVHGKGGEIYGKLAFEVPTARLRWLIDRLSTEALSNLRRATFAVLGRAERGSSKKTLVWKSCSAASLSCSGRGATTTGQLRP